MSEFSNKLFLNVVDVMNIFKCSRTKAYDIIRIVNSNLKHQGFRSCTGKVLTSELFNTFKIDDEFIQSINKMNECN